MKLPLERIIAAVLFAGVALLFLLGLLALREFRSLETTSKLADKSRTRLVALQSANRALLSAESGQRGFLLTSNASYLNTFSTSVSTVNQSLLQIGRQLGDTNDQRGQVALFSSLANAKIAELQHTIELEKSKHHAEALSIVQTGAGRQMMEQIQQISGTLIVEERDQVNQLSSATEADRIATAKLFEAGEFGLVLLFTSAFLFIRRSLKAQALAEKTIAEKERFLRTITDNLPVLISYTDKDEVVRFSNRTYETWLGKTPSSNIGRPLTEFLGEELYGARKEKIRSVLAGNVTEFVAVLELRNGLRQHNVLYLPDRTPEGVVEGFFGLTTDITDLKTVERKLEAQARLDSLTGLPNRRQFEEDLRQHLLLVTRDFHSFALLFLDIDHFKLINDSYGHGTGDLVLKHFGSCVQSSIRSTDVVARLGGDEFVVLLRGLQSKRDVSVVAEKIQRAVHICFTAEGQQISITTSIGGAFATHPDVTEESLLNCADSALYEAKNAGRDCFRLLDCAL